MNGKTTNCGCLHMPLFVEVAISRTPAVCSLLIRRKICPPILNVKSHITHLTNYSAYQLIGIFLAFTWNRYVQLLEFCPYEKIIILILFTPLTKCCDIIYMSSLYKAWFINSWKPLCDRDLKNIISISDIEIIKMFSTPK